MESQIGRCPFELPPAFNKVENLPSIPYIAVEILQLCKDPEAGIDEFVRLISQDPAMSVRLLKLANSCYFNNGSEITTLRDATMTLGLKTLQLMSLSFSLTSSLPKKGEIGNFQTNEYWKRSIIASVATRSFSNLLRYQKSDEAFICGLLNYIGRLVIAQCIPGEYESVFQSTEKNWPTAEHERKVLGFDYTSVGGFLLKEWNLPPEIYLPVEFALCPEELPDGTSEQIRELTQIMKMSSLAVSVLCDEEKGEALTRLNELSLQKGLTEERVNDFLIGASQGITETAALLEVELPRGYSHEDIVRMAREEMMNISLGNAANLAEIERRASALENENRQLAEKVSTDELTGIANRAGFDQVLNRKIYHSLNHYSEGSGLGLLLMDVDKFKEVNDTYGHQVGDSVLQMIGHTLKGMVRSPQDLAARYGGEEFAVIVVESSPENLLRLAERIRSEVEKLKIPASDESIRVTISIGGACSKGDVSFPIQEIQKNLIQAADNQLYRCKNSGRNCCAVLSNII